MVLHPDDLVAQIQQLTDSALAHWPEGGVDDGPPAELRVAVVRVREACDQSVEALRAAVQQLIDAIDSGSKGTTPTRGAALDALLGGLYSAARRFQHSPAAQEVWRICNEVRLAVQEVGELRGHLNELRAALMVVEDAVCAIQGYEALAPFAHVDEAYLAKYGLLQALQVGFDGAEAVGQVMGVRLRADSVPGGKGVKVTRNIVAGHPIRGNMQGESWHHLHDRVSAHDAAVIRVMSFSRREPDRWTGQTLLTDELIGNGLQTMEELLRRALTTYRAEH